MNTHTHLGTATILWHPFDAAPQKKISDEIETKLVSNTIHSPVTVLLTKKLGMTIFLITLKIKLPTPKIVK